MRKKEREMIVNVREKMSSALLQKEEKVEVGGRMVSESRGEHNVIIKDGKKLQTAGASES